MDSKTSQLKVALQNDLIMCSSLGQLSEELVLLRHSQILHLIKETGCNSILFNQLEATQPSLDAVYLQNELNAELQHWNARLAIVVPDSRSAYLARLASGELNYRIFYGNVADAVAWLKPESAGPEQKKKLLIADVPEALPMLTAALRDHFQIQHHSSWSAACVAADLGVDLVLCGIRFEDSKMFDLLEYLRTQEKTKSIPFFCIKTGRQKLPSTINGSLGIALHTRGTAGYIDYEAWVTDLGEQQASHKLVRKIEEALDASRSMAVH